MNVLPEFHVSGSGGLGWAFSTPFHPLWGRLSKIPFLMRAYAVELTCSPIFTFLGPAVWARRISPLFTPLGVDFRKFPSYCAHSPWNYPDFHVFRSGG